MLDPIVCNICGCDLPIHESYVVKMEVFADPTMQPMTGEELAQTDFDETLNELLDQMEGMTAEELQDGVHRRFEFRLCGTCQRRFLSNPLGKPRTMRVGTN